MNRPSHFLAYLLVALLPACSQPGATPEASAGGPPDARPGACYARGTTPALLETVTDQVQEAEPVTARDGRVLEPARFRTVTSTRIVRPRAESWFETPCQLRAGDAAFIAQVQRALAVRDLYAGPVSGVYDADTRRAVLRFQKQENKPESEILSLAAAQALGLVALGRDAA